MSIESSGAVPAPSDLQSTYISVNWINRPVTINSHTDYDKDKTLQTNFTQADFQKNLSTRMMVSGNDIRDIKPIELEDSLKVDIGIKPLSDFPPESSVAGFQSSSLLDGTGVVFNALQNGYPADKAIVYGKAYKAYSTTIEPNKNFVGSLVKFSCPE